MTTHHAIDHYKDGRSMVAFCKVCGAEGLELLDDCQKEIIHKFAVDEIPIDQIKQTAK